ncbi:tetratricopeptide repeat protein [Streptomyces prasinopilosus]|uniref:Tetratricopeptide (TPR) repeat n=1 Tax=Streptomyces prasinopilosus TaxID=67344 RepID=A0A1G6QTK6_9ACTN|nr:Tetratricopeptide (TPR) repeat [Streptomyces prasinopilosus]
MQELIQRRRRAGLVARTAELSLFRANFDVQPEDERHRFLFHVHGDAGVGKTFLVREFEQIARERGALTAYVDESAGSVPEALEMMCRQFAAQGHRFKGLERLLTRHRERLHEAEAAALAAMAPEPEGTPSAGSMTVARAGLAGLGLIPGVGPFAGVLDPAQLAQGADRLRAGLSARFRSHEDVRLVLSPESVLTPVLVDELSAAASDVPWTVLFLDTYERTGRFLDGWLHDLVTTDRHGPLPATLVVVTAGQRRADPARWSGFADHMTALPLAPFTEAEVRGLLAARGVVADPVVTEVLRLTGGLPVLVSTLAESRPAGPGDVEDPSATAVDRFLKWERDPVRRAAALAGALPRWLDADVFGAALTGRGREDAHDGEAYDEDRLDELYGWLRDLPFVGGQAPRLRYHDVVRAPMLRLQRDWFPRTWAERQRRLAAVFRRWREETETGRDTAELWADEEWRELRLAESYHLLCARERSMPEQVLRDLVEACDQGESVAGRWTGLLEDAGRDADLEDLARWGRDLSEALEEGGPHAVVARLLGRLPSPPPPRDPAGGPVRHRRRGPRPAGEDRGLPRVPGDRAVPPEGVPSGEAPHRPARRSGREQGRRRPDGPPSGTTRPGRVRPRAASSEDAPADGVPPAAAPEEDVRSDAPRSDAPWDDGTWDGLPSDGAVPDDAPWDDGAWDRLPPDGAVPDDGADGTGGARAGGAGAAWGSPAPSGAPPDGARDEDAREEDTREEDALPGGAPDEGEAEPPDWRNMVLSPQSAARVLRSRAVALAARGDYADALAHLRQAAELAPDDAGILALMGEYHRTRQAYPAALRDLSEALSLDPEHSFAWASLGATRLALGDPAAALADLDRALELKPDYPWALIRRARVRRELGDPARQLADLERAVLLQPDSPWAHCERGDALHAAGRGAEALAHFDRALALDPEYTSAYASRGVALSRLGRHAEALADLDRALERDPSYAWARAQRDEVLRRLGERARPPGHGPEPGPTPP